MVTLSTKNSKTLNRIKVNNEDIEITDNTITICISVAPLKDKKVDVAVYKYTENSEPPKLPEHSKYSICTKK